MSWHFSRALGEVYSAELFSDGVQCAPSNLTSSASNCSCNDKTTATCQHSPSGTMFVPSTDVRGEALLTSFRAAFRAKTSPASAVAAVWQASKAACGVSSPGSSTRSRRRGSSSKTPHTCVLADLSVSSKTLPAWGMTRAGEFWALPPWAPHTPVNASGLLPTPTGAKNEISPSMTKWPAHRRFQRFIRDRLLPTLRANKWGLEDSHGRTAAWEAIPKEWRGGRWTSSLREWLMGWPIGWTAREPLATDRFREWLRWHGNFLEGVE